MIWTVAGGRNARWIGNALSLYFACSMYAGQTPICFMSCEVTVSTVKQTEAGRGMLKPANLKL